ncbi:MAG: HD domain-containing protein [Deltaproteobacteria bacterium]|jgi:(p)ppGpp synthase/HD superfamily hydrolase|nr:HD domain-containing protein [Deltaproteobacteria bacterium]
MTSYIDKIIESRKLHLAAWQIAARKHNGQLYPGSDLPYLVHIGQVLLCLEPALAENPQMDKTLAILCAILHDVVEDAGVTREEIADLFGPSAAAGVAALSKNPNLKKGRERMEDSLERILAEPKEVWLVKLSDRAANMSFSPPPNWSREKILAYADEAKLIDERLGQASPLLSAWLKEKIAEWEGAR